MEYMDYQAIVAAIRDWVLSDGLSVIAILVGAFIVQRFLYMFIDRAIRRVVVHDQFTSAEAEKKREDTLIRIIHSTLNVALVVVVLMMVLSFLGVEIGPLIAAAGIAGLAFGFGGQYLIRDVISGLFIVLENQFRVGDVVSLDGTAGTVEDITLRMTTLRDLDGVVHHIPNGVVEKVSNMSKQFARVNLDVGVSYSADLEHVIAVTDQVGKDLADDPAFENIIVSPPKFLRVNDFGDSAVVIKILGDVKPLKQWEVTGELRKRLKIAYDREGIEIPFPQRVIHQAS
jgi:small conductance mechanosensitive channel